MGRTKPYRRRWPDRFRRLVRRRWRLAVRVLGVVAVLGAAGAYGYQTGLILAQKETRRAAKRVSELSRTVAELEQYNAVLARAADQARLNESAWRKRYEALLARGVDGAVELVVPAVAGDGVAMPACASEPRVETFRVDTPVSKGATEAAGFGGNRVVVSASGISAMSRNGEPLAWFDPDQPVALTFTSRDGRAESATGILPIEHRMVVDGLEYRFRASRAGRGLVEIAGTPCRPGGSASPQ